MKQAISALSNSGRYSATTFNLAFYLSTLLKKEIEGETIEREKESKVNVAAYAEAPAAAPAVAPVTPFPSAASMAQPADAETKSRMPLVAVAAGVIVAVGAGAFIALRPKTAPAAAKPAAVVARKTAPKMIPQPIVAAIPAGNTAVTATTGSSDPAAQKKAFEAAVAEKLQAEMMKLQSDLNKQLKQQQSKNAPVQMASMISTSAQQQTDDRGAAAALDQRRIASRQEAAAPTQQPAPQQTAPSMLTQQQPSAPQVTQTQAPVSTIHEGDVVDVTELDRLPEPLGPIRPTYPQMALQQRLQTTVILSTLISENGEVIDVKILRGDTRFGFNDAAIRAVRSARFSAPMKDGKRVKTWRPQTIAFRM
jgi:TonB family protein